MKIKAFTLAEVLITLAIIGVVAAMTMPALIQNYQKRALETQIKHFYSTFSQAVKQYMADYGTDDLRNTPLASDNYGEYGYASPEAIASIRNFMTKYLKVVKECDHAPSDCFAKEYRSYDGKVDNDYGIHAMNNGYYDVYGYRDYVLADGAVVKIAYWCTMSGPVDIIVDVNGKKGPNKAGYDVLSMSLFYDGVLDAGGVDPECRKNNDYCYPWEGEKNPSSVRDNWFQSYLSSDNSSSSYGDTFGHLLENNFKFDY